MPLDHPKDKPVVHEGVLPVDHADIYFRQVGQGQPVVILHGGPDFDHTYLLPELDLLSDSCRLIYYDQRGRGKSAGKVLPEEVSIRSDVADLERLRVFFHLNKIFLLSHSWGGVLALEYALRYPNRVSRLILANPAPVSTADYLLLRQSRRQRAPADVEKLRAWSADTRYQAGDPDTVAQYYRIHFRTALQQPEHLESVIKRLRSSFTKEGILKARAIEKRLMNETWWSNNYNLLPQLGKLRLPALVIHGAQDFIPVECADHIARAIPGAHLVLLKECGHFAYLERPGEFHQAVAAFIQDTGARPSSKPQGASLT